MTIVLNLTESLLLGLFAKFLGASIKNKITFLHRFNFPDPIIGGFIFAILNFMLYIFTPYKVHYDLSLQIIFMQLFFTSLGLNTPILLLYKHKNIFIKFFIIAGLLSICQFFIGISLCSFLNLNPLIGIIAGPISLFGDFSFAVVFGRTIENLGFFEGKDLAIASATFGVIANSIIAIPIGTYLINRLNLIPKTKNKKLDLSLNKINSNYSNNLLTNITFFIAIIVFSNLLSLLIHNVFNIVFPVYIICLIIGLFINWISPYKIDKKFSFTLNKLSLNLFLSMSIISLKIWDLLTIIKPLFFILIFQFVFVIFYSYIFTFYIFGKNYKAILLSCGLCGLSLGSISNSISNMNELSKKYGSYSEVFLIVPLVGTFIMNFFLIPLILYSINFFI